jgi:hypothetical protein
MWSAVYNSGIPQILSKSVFRAPRAVNTGRRVWFTVFFVLIAISSYAADWSTAERQLAHKIAAVTGPGAVAITIENRSSLGRRDSDAVQNGLRESLERLGLHFVNADQAAATIAVTLSENASSYVWVARIRQSEADAAVVMVSVPGTTGFSTASDSMPLTLRKSLIWMQDSPILDVAVLEENTVPTRIAVLDAQRVTLYRWQGAKWQPEVLADITHANPWPRDMRGRLIPAKDHLLDAYLPGVVCHSTNSSPLAMSCHEADDPWPLVAAGLNTSSVFPSAGSNANPQAVAPLSAFFAPMRNFFTGVLTPPQGKVSVSRFYSAAPLPRGRYTLWMFGGVDGQIHMVDGITDHVARSNWGSDITSVKTACGAGWQVLAPTSGEGGSDSVRAYEFPDRDPVAVTSVIDFPGPLTTLWTEAKGDTAIAIAKDQETGNYEAFRVAVACNQ